MSDASPNRTRLLGLLVLLLVVVILAPRLRSESGGDDAPARATCPAEFPQTRMAATLLWSNPEVGYASHEPSPVERHHPDDLRLLKTESDAETCAKIHAVIPDSLRPLGLLAPRFATFYQVGDVYVVPVEPTISPREMDAETSGEKMIDKVGITFVLDSEMNVVSAVEN